MLKDIVEARALEGHRLFVRFEDGVEGTVDVGKLVPFDGVFEPLRRRALFVQVSVNTDLGTVCWPGGAKWINPGMFCGVSCRTPSAARNSIAAPQSPQLVLMRASRLIIAAMPSASQMQFPKQLNASSSTTNGVGTAENGFAIRISSE